MREAAVSDKPWGAFPIDQKIWPPTAPAGVPFLCMILVIDATAVGLFLRGVWIHGRSDPKNEETKKNRPFFARAIGPSILVMLASFFGGLMLHLLWDGGTFEERLRATSIKFLTIANCAGTFAYLSIPNNTNDFYRRLSHVLLCAVIGPALFGAALSALGVPFVIRGRSGAAGGLQTSLVHA